MYKSFEKKNIFCGCAINKKITSHEKSFWRNEVFFFTYHKKFCRNFLCEHKMSRCAPEVIFQDFLTFRKLLKCIFYNGTTCFQEQKHRVLFLREIMCVNIKYPYVILIFFKYSWNAFSIMELDAHVNQKHRWFLSF